MRIRLPPIVKDLALFARTPPDARSARTALRPSPVCRLPARNAQASAGTGRQQAGLTERQGLDAKREPPSSVAPELHGARASSMLPSVLQAQHNS